MKFLFSILFGVLCSTSSLSALEPAFQQSPDECVVFLGVGRQGSQYYLQFLNNCEELRYISVCIDQGLGSLRPVTTFQRVQPGGIWKVFTWPGYRPRDAWWHSGTKRAAMPPPCG